METIRRVVFVVVAVQLAMPTVAHKQVNTANGYFLDEIETAERPQMVQCPSDEVITVLYKCHVDGQWVDCNKKHCCLGYTFIAGRCISDDLDPCSLNLCEQNCATYFGRIVCTCFHGYRFDAQRRKEGQKPYCIDVDECKQNNGGCQHECSNAVGEYRCTCNEGYRLLADNTTCHLSEDYPANRSAAIQLTANQSEASNENCFTPCSLSGELRNRIQVLEEKIQTLNTAIKLYSFGAGPPGPEGPPGPPGEPGPRGFPGTDGSPGSSVESTDFNKRPGMALDNFHDDEDNQYDDEHSDEKSMNTFVSVLKDGEEKFCQCIRGAMGPPGAPGREGLKGSKGDQGVTGEQGGDGNLDLLLLMIADLRFDIDQMKTTIYGKKMPAEYNLAAAMIDRSYLKQGEKREATKTSDKPSFSSTSVINDRDVEDHDT